MTIALRSNALSVVPARCSLCQHAAGLSGLLMPVAWIGRGLRCPQCRRRASAQRLLPPALCLAAVPLCVCVYGAVPWTLAWVFFHVLLVGVVAMELWSARIPMRWLAAGVLTGLAGAAAQGIDADPSRDRLAGAVAGFLVVWLAGVAQAHWRSGALGESSLPEALLFSMAGAWLGWRALPALMLGSFALLMLATLVRHTLPRACAHWLDPLVYPRPGAPAPPWSPVLAAAIVIHEGLRNAL
jgi:prepilin signal peptidase PulO-like enzyme (type II secretory pathway)